MSLSNPFSKSTHFKNYGLMLLVCLLAYWPLSFGVFSVKNDAIHYFLPYRFHISEAIRHGEWPFWSPYIYLGNPVYGDMQSGAWNPFVWLFSLIGRYDLTLFHYENLLYIFLGGLGMYKLVFHYTRHSTTSLLIGMSYMLSGFLLGGQLINWLASAAFIPFVFLYYVRGNGYGDAIKTAIVLFLLFTAGYPSFFIVTCYLLMVLFIIRVIDQYRKKIGIREWNKFLSTQVLLAAVFVGLSLPAIISFYDLLPYYQRGSGTSYSGVVQNSFEAKHLASLLFPSSIKVSGLVSATDLTCRNIYAGLFVLPILAAFPPKLNRRNILLIALFLFAFLFSLGDVTPVRKLCYQFIPLMDSFRHPSQMRLFMILSLLLLTAPGLKKVFTNEMTAVDHKRLVVVTQILSGLMIIVLIIAGLGSTIIKKIGSIELSNEGLKAMLQGLTFKDVIAINALIQIIFLTGFYWWLKKKSRSSAVLAGLWVLNLFIMAQLVLPISFVSSIKPKTINAFIHASPKGFPVAYLERTLAENSTDVLDHYNEIALTGFYNKKITISKVMNSPAFLAQQEAFILDDRLYDHVSSLPVAYISGHITNINRPDTIVSPSQCHLAFWELDDGRLSDCDSLDKATIRDLSANKFTIETETKDEAMLVLTQNYHHHWKTTVDGKETNILRVNRSFMGVNLSPGKHKIIFTFHPSNTITAIWVQLTTVVLLILVATILLTRNKKI